MAKSENLMEKIGVVRAGVVDGDEPVGASGYGGYDPGGQSRSERQRAQVDTSFDRVPVRPRAGQRKLAEAFLRYGPERDSNFKVAIERVSQRGIRGESVMGGWCGEFLDPITERDIAQNYGGGRYKVLVYGTHPKSQQPGHILDEVLVDIEGAPKPVGAVTTPDKPNGNDRDRDGMYDRLMRDRDNLMMRNREFNQPRFQPQQGYQPPTYPHQQRDDSSRVLAETLRDVVGTQASGKDQLIDRLERMAAFQSRGPDQEVVHSLTSQHEAHKQALQARYEAMLTEERERATRELERTTARLERQLEEVRIQFERRYEDTKSSLERQLQVERDASSRSVQSERDRYDKDVSRLANQLEDERRDHKRDVERLDQSTKTEIDRLINDKNTEIARLTNSTQEEVKRIRHDLEMQVASERRAKEESLSLERERSKTIIDQVSNTAQNQVERAIEQYKMNTSSIERYNDAMLKVTEVKSDSMVEQLRETVRRIESELHLARTENSRLRERVEEREDIPSQVGKLRALSETLAELTGGGEDETAIVPATTGDGILGKVEGLLNTRFGKRAGEVAGAVIGNVFQTLSNPAAAQQQQQQQQQQQAMMQQQQYAQQQALMQQQQQYAQQRPQTVQAMPQQQQYAQAAPPPRSQPPRQQAPVPQPVSAQNVEAQIEAALYGGSAQVPQAPPPQQAPVVDSQAEGLARVASWVAAVETAIETGAPPGDVADSLAQAGLPPEALSGMLNNPIEEIVGQITAFVQTKGILGSEKGLAYMRRVQELLKGRFVSTETLVVQ